MKRTTSILLCIGLLAAVSCTKEVQDRGDNPVREGYMRIQLTATSENDDAKTVIVQGEGSTRTVEWVSGDKILVSYGNGTVEGEAVEAGRTTTFSVEVPQASDLLLGVYPADAPATFEGEGIILAIPQEQSGSFAKANMAVTSTSTKDKNCQFYNATSYVKFSVTDPDITKIVVESIGGQPLVGKLPLSFDKDRKIVTGTPTDTYASAYLLVDGTGDYYMSILPGIDYSDGLLIRFFIDGDEKYSVARGKYVTENAICVQRSQIANFGQLDKRVGNIYVTVAGSGEKDGSSWENAMSSEDMAKLLTDNSSASAVKDKCAKLDGNTFRLGAGIYDFGQSPVVDFTLNEDICSFRVVGGYASGGSDVPDTGLYTSEISGTGLHEALIVKKNVDVTLSNVTISGGYAKTNNDAALQVLGSAQVRLQNCSIKGNSIEGGKTLSSAGVYVDQTSSIVAKESSFTENTGDEACALKIDGTAKIEDCAFTKNKAVHRYGAVSVNSNDVVFTGCSFVENSVTADNEEESCKGGAVGFTGGEATFEDCIFTGNYAYQGGAVALAAAGNLNLKRCKFDSNHTYNKYSDDTKAWGGAIDITGAGYLKADRCLFDANYSTRGGAVSSQDGMAHLWFNACVFGSNHITAGHGTDVYLSFSEECAFNNCCFIEGSYSTLGSGNADWIGVEAAGTLLMANTSMIGSPLKAVDATTGSNGLIRLGYVEATEYFINNIIVLPNTNSNRSILGRSNLHQVYLYGNKRSLATDAGSVFTTGYGDCDGYLQGSAYFVGQELVKDPVTGDIYWKWTGELRIGSDTGKMSGEDVRGLMADVMPDFCTWLTQSCGNAMYKDQLGNARSETYWPGSYQE